MRSMFALIVIALSLSVMAGCGFRDIDKRFFVVVLGVDRGVEKEYRVSLKLAIPSPEIRPGQEKFLIIDQEADTVAEAVHLMESEVDKELDFGHAKMILFGEKVARKAIFEEIDWFNRRRDIQQISYLGIGRPTAYEIIKHKPSSERLAGNALLLSFDQEGTSTSYIMTEFLFDFYRRWMEHGKDPYLPVIETYDDSYRINRVAVYNQSEMKAILKPDETSTLHQLVREFPQFIVEVNDGDESFIFYAQSLHLSFSFPAAPDERPVVRIHARVGGVVEQSMAQLFNRNWLKLEEAIEREIAIKYVSLLEKLRDLKVDPVGLGLKYVATHYHAEQDWETWRSLYPDVQFDVRVDVNLSSTGLIE